MNLLHQGTVIQVRFGRPDGGDILAIEPITIPLERFSLEEFMHAFDTINGRRAQLEAAIAQAQLEPALTAETNGATPTEAAGSANG